jgi:hypothetical protein
MNMRHLIAAGLLALSAHMLYADDADKLAAKEILDANQKALVEIRGVLKLSMSSADLPMPGSNQEQPVSVSAVVIDPNGLSVASATLINPLNAMPDLSFTMEGKKVNISMKGQLSDLKMIMADGTEIPVKLVLEDRDLDLAFCMPEKSTAGTQAKFSCVAKAAAAKPQLFEKLVVIDRLNESLNREPTVGFHRVHAIVEKPRTFFVSADLQNISAPIFNLKKEFVGFSVTRVANRSSNVSEMISEAMNSGGQLVILPAQDIVSIAEQAAKKSAAPAPSAGEAKP